MTTDARRHAAATQRNREPILAALSRVLPGAGRVLEIGSGTGEHGVFFTPRLPGITWQPSDPDPAARASVAAWREHAGEHAARIAAPIELDARAPRWPVEGQSADGPTLPIVAIVAINVIHISPWATCEGIVAGAGRVLAAGGVLYLYGPYRRGGRHTAPSNEAFDRHLRGRDPSWGVRDLDEVAALALRHGLELEDTVEMPANNLSVVFRRRGEPAGTS